MTSRRLAGVTIRTWWTLVICVAVSSIATWFAIDHANANDRRAQTKANLQFQHALIVSNRKFQQALRVSTAQSAYAQNKAACGFRKLTHDSIIRARKVLADPTATRASRISAHAAIVQARSFLENQITVPPGFDCATLPKKPPK